MKLRYILKETKNIFKSPKKVYYLGKIHYGSPYFYPWGFNKNILNIRKVKPKFIRCNFFTLFGYQISYGWPIYITWYGLGWKDKFGTPRYEWSPSFQIYFFYWQFCIFWNAPDNDNDKYYEMLLWYLNYSNKDILIAKETWGWINYNTKQSTWNNNYLITK